MRLVPMRLAALARNRMMTALARRGRTLRRDPLLHDFAAEQFMAMPAVSRSWTAREVRALVADNPLRTPRYELVDGELLVTPSPSRWHQLAVTELVVALHVYLEANPVGYALASPSDVELEPEFLSQPDVYVVPMGEWRRLGDSHAIGRIALAIEVLSPSSSRHDRVRKRPKYQRHVPEYWIVDLDARLVERWRPGDERPEILSSAIEWRASEESDALRLDLAAFFARVLDDAGR